MPYNIDLASDNLEGMYPQAGITQQRSLISKIVNAFQTFLGVNGGFVVMIPKSLSMNYFFTKFQCFKF